MKVLVLCLFVLAPQAAWAGAWTMEEDHGQVITGLTFSAADRSFGGGPNPSSSIFFRRALLQSYGEYGWKDGVTLFGTLESAYVEVTQNGVPPVHAVDDAGEGGVRLRLNSWLKSWLGWQDDGVLSLEASLRSGGAFNFAVSANSRASGQSGQLRLLYGRGFQLDGRDAFAEIQAGEEWFADSRPDETPLDLTFGLWLDPDNLVMAQSFNLFAPKGALGAYPVFESHKLQLSWVRHLTANLLLQAGGFFSPAGKNALVEEGLSLSLWARF
jgi:hypothetical protein